MINPPKGYLDITWATLWADQLAQEHCSSLEGAKTSRFGGVALGRTAADILREALESGELLAAGIREVDGELITISAAAWRRGFRRMIGPPREDPLLSAFSEARCGRTVPVSTNSRGVPDGWATPVIAQADLARWAGEVPPAEPVERPKDWPAPMPSTSRAELASAWLHGYATHAKQTGAPPPKRDNSDMIAACKAATSCTVDEVRAAYHALPVGLRNPSPKERQAERPSAG